MAETTAVAHRCGTRITARREANRPVRHYVVGRPAGSAGLRAGQPAFRADPKTSPADWKRAAATTGSGIHIPDRYLYTLNTAHRLVFSTEPEAGLNGGRWAIRAASCWAGCLVDQRHDIHARPGRRLRPLAPAGQSRLGHGDDLLTVLQALGGFHKGLPTRMHGAGGSGGWRRAESAGRSLDA